MALLCACEDGKRCAECERIEFIAVHGREAWEQVQAWQAEADRIWLEWLTRNSLDDTEGEP